MVVLFVTQQWRNLVEWWCYIFMLKLIDFILCIDFITHHITASSYHLIWANINHIQNVITFCSLYIFITLYTDIKGSRVSYCIINDPFINILLIYKTFSIRLIFRFYYNTRRIAIQLLGYQSHIIHIKALY